jgi:LuxR family maltose regulon positive regulatory protein
VRAALRLAAGDPEAAAHLARAVELVDADVSEQTVPLRLAATLIEAVAATTGHDGVRALRAADIAEALLAQAPRDRVAAHPELRAIILYSRGAAQSWTGALEDAVTTLTDGARAGASTGCERTRLACLEQLALAHAYRGRLQEAADVAGEAVQLAGRQGQEPPHHSFAGTVALAWVAGERWAVATAWRHLRAAEAAADTSDEPLATVAVALVRARLLGGRGEPRAAARVLSDLRASRGGATPAWLEQEIILTGARLSVAMGRPAEALAAVETLKDPASAQTALVTAAALVARGDTRRGSDLVLPVVDRPDLPAPLLIEAWLVLAVAASERGEASTVRESLGRALALAAPDAHRRAFHEAGFRLRHLLRSDAGLAASYRSLDAGAAPPKSPPRTGRPQPEADAPIVVDALSVRELQVLRYLAAMLGTEEIADTMYLSVNTVKTHVRSILRKLAVSRRNEAVRRARQLGLV